MAISTRRSLFLLLLITGVILFLSGCNSDSQLTESLTPSPSPTITLPPPDVRVTPAPDASSALNGYLDAWRANDYEKMYAMLTERSKTTIDYDSFIKKHQEFANAFALKDLQYNFDNETVTPLDGVIDFSLNLQSSVVSDLLVKNQAQLKMEDDSWKIEWNPGLILPQMADGSYLQMDLNVPERGNIYDRYGNLMAGTSDAVAVGLYPDYLDPERTESVLSLLSRLTGIPVPVIENRYINYPPGTVGYLPLGEVSAQENQRLIDILSGASGVVIEPYTARFYPENGVAPHAVGYVSSLQQGAEAEEYLRKGYRIDASIGREGVESWGEELLAGKNGATLYLLGSDGKPKEILGETPLEPSQVITTTLEKDFQAGVQQAITGFRGSVVVLERDTGRVLAMASSPGFDPNAYQTANYNWNSLIGDIESNQDLPRFNRATQGQYPLGSVFKLITMAAGLESGRFTPESTYDCQYIFDEIAGSPLNDWTWDHFQDDGVTQPSGLLTLPQGLIRSCNPWFYKIGLELFNSGLGKAVSDMARGFGLGQKTGLEGLQEETGNIPEPQGALDATNIAIGQGDVLVTPLQVARFIAAIGNGGTLFRPQIIESYGSKDGVPVFSFKPEETGKLPISKENLRVIQQAMRGVVESKIPRGTAYNTFTGFGIPVFGKTGTATSSAGDPHAWFAGYTGAENENRPDIAIAVIVENQGEGSEWAAPIFRRIVELYFNGQPGRLYRWETGYGIVKTPTPFGYEEPTPNPDDNP